MPRIKVDKQDLVLANKGVEIRLSRDYSQHEEDSMRKLRELLKP